MASGSDPLGEGLLPPPPGVTPNFDNPESQAGRLIVASIVCPILAILFVAARGSSKTLSRSWGWDDYASIVGLAFSVALSAVSIVPAKRYGIGRHEWDVPIIWLTPYLKYIYAETLVYVIGTYFVKLSLLILYYRVFGVNQHFRRAVYFVMGLWSTYIFISIFITIFQCIPVQKAWDLELEGHCFDLVKLGISSGYVNIITDTIILSLPIPMVWNLHLSVKVRLAVMAIFLTGSFVIATTIVRQVIVVRTLDSQDATWFSANSLMWLIIEINVSIICGCMPTLKPLLRRTIWRNDTKTPQSYSFKKNSHAALKDPNTIKSNGDSMLDASYIELGQPGTNRDVHIAADDAPMKMKQSSFDQGNGIIVKTDTFGQVVHYKGRDDMA